jgi:ATPase subunit of ABC transporter with duplicated ATPase domains
VDEAGPEIAALAAATMVSPTGSARSSRSVLISRAGRRCRPASASWQIGAALATLPDVLILDEPTNHLDAEARAVLVPVLERFTGIGVPSPHDRECSTRSRTRPCVARGRARRTAARTRRPGDLASRRSGEPRHAREPARRRPRSKRRIGERRTEQQHAVARMRIEQAHEGHPRQRRARRFKQTRRRSAVNQLGHEIARTHSALERTREKLDAIQITKDVGATCSSTSAPAKVPRLSVVQAEQISAGDRVVLERIDLAFERGSRIWLRGANGSGKTTLLRALANAARVPRERLLVLPQELGADQERALLDEARALGAEARGRLMALVAALGVEPRALLASAQPSPGEARKLAMALGLSRQVFGFLLDEPTNHLDLPSIERLESALAAYPGALLLVTHDARLAARCTNVSWSVTDRRVTIRSD